MEAPKCPHCGRRSLYTIYGGEELMLRCRKCQRVFSVLLVPPAWYRWIKKQMEELKKLSKQEVINERDG